MTLPGRGTGMRRPASGDAHAGAHRSAVPFASASKSPTVPRSRPITTISPRSTSRKTIRRARCTTRFTWTDGRHLLRTHTSPIQIRYMETAPAADKDHRAGPRLSRRLRCHAFADVPPGRRAVDRRARQFADLKGVMADFLRRFFERDDLKVRFRPSFFPFTEPSAEIDMSFGDGWLEIGGCGMVHPNVLQQRQYRQRAIPGFRLRPGARPADHAALRRERPAAVLRKRFAVSETVQLARGRRTSCSIQSIP